jgi:hypothetical protein
MLQIVDEHTDLIGKLAKLTEFGVKLEEQYKEMFNVGNVWTAKMVHNYCYCKGRYEISLMFVDEPPIKRNGVTWFCLKEVGQVIYGDLRWFTLNQLVLCE